MECGREKSEHGGLEPTGLNCDFHDRRLEAENRAVISSAARSTILFQHLADLDGRRRDCEATWTTVIHGVRGRHSSCVVTSNRRPKLRGYRPPASKVDLRTGEQQ